MAGLAQADPAGRLDVLVFRVMERVAQTQCPREWPVFQPFVERWLEKKFNPKRKRNAKKQ